MDDKSSLDKCGLDKGLIKGSLDKEGVDQYALDKGRIKVFWIRIE